MSEATLYANIPYHGRAWGFGYVPRSERYQGQVLRGRYGEWLTPVLSQEDGWICRWESRGIRAGMAHEDRGLLPVPHAWAVLDFDREQEAEIERKESPLVTEAKDRNDLKPLASSTLPKLVTFEPKQWQAHCHWYDDVNGFAVHLWRHECPESVVCHWNGFIIRNKYDARVLRDTNFAIYFDEKVAVYDSRERLQQGRVDNRGHRLIYTLNHERFSLRRIAFSTACWDDDLDEETEMEITNGLLGLEYAMPAAAPSQKTTWMGWTPSVDPQANDSASAIAKYRQLAEHGMEEFYDFRPYTSYTTAGRGGAQPSFGSHFSIPIWSGEKDPDLVDTLVLAAEEDGQRPKWFTEPDTKGKLWKASDHPNLFYDDSIPHFRGSDTLGVPAELLNPRPSGELSGFTPYVETHEERGPLIAAYKLTGDETLGWMLQHMIQEFLASGRVKSQWPPSARGGGRWMRSVMQAELALRRTGSKPDREFVQGLERWIENIYFHRPVQEGWLQPIKLDGRIGKTLPGDYFSPWEEAQLFWGLVLAMRHYTPYLTERASDYAAKLAHNAAVCVLTYTKWFESHPGWVTAYRAKVLDTEIAQQEVDARWAELVPNEGSQDWSYWSGSVFSVIGWTWFAMLQANETDSPPPPTDQVELLNRLDLTQEQKDKAANVAYWMLTRPAPDRIAADYALIQKA